MRSPLAERLRRGVVLLDGGVGSGLIARGLPAGTPPEVWNLEHPALVRAVHAEHVAAGSEVVQTNTFGANDLALARNGLAERTEEINRRAVEIAREAAGDKRLVAGDMGPSGRMLAPLGDVTGPELVDAFARQARILAAAGADYLAVETMIDLREALAALDGAKEATDLEVTVCLTFERRPRGYFTIMGDRPADAARALVEAGAASVGANCSIGSLDMVALAAELVAAWPGPVMAKPNAGLPETVDGRPVYRQPPEDFAADMAAMVEGGVRLVGGCCGTDGRFIAAVARVLPPRTGTRAPT